MSDERARTAEQGLHDLPELPTMPDFQEEDFRHSVEYLEGFEDFMDLLPDASAAAQAPISEHDDALLPTSSAPLPEPNNPTAQPGLDEDRRQFRNRMSQRRFRERQKVFCQSLPALQQNSLHNCVIWQIGLVTVACTCLGRQQSSMGMSDRHSTFLQARASSLEAQLEHASEQLRQLQLLQEAHRTKIKLLEKLVHLNKQADIRSVHGVPSTQAVSPL